MTTTLVDGVEPITFRKLAARFGAKRMTPKKYRAFRLPLPFEDIMNPNLAQEIVEYRSLAHWFHQSFKGRSRANRKIAA